MAKKLGRVALDNVHFHVSGIEYNKGGERRHLPLRASDLKYEEMLRAFKDFDLQGTVICEETPIRKKTPCCSKRPTARCHSPG
jgi:deoxyribonuclease-4